MNEADFRNQGRLVLAYYDNPASGQREVHIAVRTTSAISGQDILIFYNPDFSLQIIRPATSIHPMSDRLIPIIDAQSDGKKDEEFPVDTVVTAPVPEAGGIKRVALVVQAHGPNRDVQFLHDDSVRSINRMDLDMLEGWTWACKWSVDGKPVWPDNQDGETFHGVAEGGERDEPAPVLGSGDGDVEQPGVGS